MSVFQMYAIKAFYMRERLYILQFMHNTEYGCNIRRRQYTYGCLLKHDCEFPTSVLQRVLPSTKFSILLCKWQEAEITVARIEGLVLCPFCHFTSISPPEDKIFKYFNTSIKYKYLCQFAICSSDSRVC